MAVAANISQYTIEVIGLDEPLRVYAFQGEEGLSHLFHYEISIVSTNDTLTTEDFLHKAAVLQILDKNTDQQRIIHGYITRSEKQPSPNRFTTYKIRVEPKLRYLAYKTDSRIYQEQTLQAIITQVLESNNIDSSIVKWDVSRDPVYPYCVQYQETQLNFVMRLLEKEGVYFYFTHELDKHVLHFSDTQQFQPLNGESSTIRYQSGAGMLSTESHITTVQMFNKQSTTLRDTRDRVFTQPNFSIDAQAKSTGDVLAKYTYPGNFSIPADATHYANVMLETDQVYVRYITATSNDKRIEPSKKMTVSSHPRADLNDEYLIVYATFEGKQPQSLEEFAPSSEVASYRNKCMLLPSQTAFRPPLSIHKQEQSSVNKNIFVIDDEKAPVPTISGSQTAWVTGPAGEEIYTDQYGRVKVQFHWDRQGQFSEQTSCWLRTTQHWTGSKWGATAIPRVGQEVIVSFEHGNPDKPVISGMLYQARNKTPYALPAKKTVTTFKTQSSSGGEGFNELRFDDAAGSEQIFVHAEKEMDKHVINDQRITVVNNTHYMAENNHFQSTQNEHHINVSSSLKQEAAGAVNLKIDGAFHLKAGMSLNQKANQTIHIKAGQKIVLQAGLEINLSAGSGGVALNPAGVTLAGAAVGVQSGGGGGSAGSASPQSPQTAMEAAISTPGRAFDSAQAGAASEVEAIPFSTAGGQAITRSSAEALKTWVEFALLDEQGAPIVGQSFLIKDAAGTEAAGKTDSAGKARAEGMQPGFCDISYTSIEGWHSAQKVGTVEPHPEPIATTHTVAQGENMIAIAKKYGIRSGMAIYNHPDNADFRALRPNPNILQAGDVVNIPQVEKRTANGVTEQTNEMVLKQEKEVFKLRVQNKKGKALAGKRIKMNIAGQEIDQVLGPDGTLEVEIPQGAEMGESTMEVFASAEAEEPSHSYAIETGKLDPVDSIKGIQSRLNALGYEAGTADGIPGKKTAAAAKDFQADVGLVADGVPGEKTQAALLEKYGS